MTMKIIGRKLEQQILNDVVESNRPEFVCVYGRRRVGKTYLIKEYFNNTFSFYVSGTKNDNKKAQLKIFNNALKKYGSKIKKQPSDWTEAFNRLEALIESDDIYRMPQYGKIVVFIDELPWFDTKKSGFKVALENFCNTYVTSKENLILVVCGSATTWVTKNLLNNKGGFHNRLTRRIYLKPFTLKEISELQKNNGIEWSDDDVAESYMIFGGIPYYHNMLLRHFSLYQNVDYLCYDQYGPLHDELNELFSSLFTKSEKYVDVIRALSKKRYGLTRDEIIKESGLSGGGMLSRILEELEQHSFIRKYKNFNSENNNCIYQLVDPFILFSINILEKKDNKSYFEYVGTPSYYSNLGYAFEMLVLNNISLVKSALGISGISTKESSFRSMKSAGGTQIDLLIDRKDNIINLCEIKFSKDEFEIDADYYKNLNRKIEVFRQESKTKKIIHLTFVTFNGLAHNKYSSIVINEITKADLI